MVRKFVAVIIFIVTLPAGFLLWTAGLVGMTGVHIGPTPTGVLLGSVAISLAILTWAAGYKLLWNTFRRRRPPVSWKTSLKRVLIYILLPLIGLYALAFTFALAGDETPVDLRWEIAGVLILLGIAVVHRARTKRREPTRSHSRPEKST